MTDTPWNQDRRKQILDELLDPDLAEKAGFAGGFNWDTAILLQILRELRKP